MIQKMSNLFIRISALALCALLLTGCAVMRPEAENATPPDINYILATLKTRYDLVDSMRTLMNVTIETPDQDGELREFLSYQKPDKLRIDVMGIFNEPKVVALAVGKSFRIYFVAENEVIKGDLSDDVIKDIFDVDLRVSDIRSSIFANPFLNGNLDDLEIKSYGDEYLIQRPSAHAGCREEISSLARNVTVIKWRIMDADDNLIQEITFSGYKKIGMILRPLRAAIYRPVDGTRIFIESVNPEINVEMSEMTFSLPIPEGAKVYQLSDMKKNRSPEPDADHP